MEIFSDFFKPYIFMSGEGLLVEGIKRIVLWESGCIILQSRERIRVSGECLKLEYKGEGAVSVSGKIQSVELLK